jgi:hypothetical protein
MTGEPDKLSFFDVAALDAVPLTDMFGSGPEADAMYEIFGRDLVTRTVLLSDTLSVFHETAKPGEQVRPHCHGTLQIDYVLAGELVFGNRRVGPGMGVIIPDTPYAWRAGDAGAEWIEIHAGAPGIRTDVG